MAKTNPGREQITQVKAPANTDLPAHLRDRKPMGIETMKEFVILPKLKVVQKSAGKELLDAGNKVGDLLVLPTRTKLRAIKTLGNGAPSTEGERFVFIPIFFFPSWVTLNHIDTKGREPTYLKYTIDKNDPLVQACRNPATREVPHPTNPKLMVKNCEQLNFVVLVEDAGELSNQPIVITFMKGEYRTGSDLSARIRMSNADIFARRWVGFSKYRPGQGKGDWYGVEVQRFEDGLLGDEKFAKLHGDESPWVTAEQLPMLEKLHLEVSKQFEEKGIRGEEDLDEAIQAGDPAASPAGNKF